MFIEGNIIDANIRNRKVIGIVRNIEKYMSFRNMMESLVLCLGRDEFLYQYNVSQIDEEQI